ncbi:MAG: hypothetical protein IJN08_03455 [Clostridia bacterium]|nr:hypothetical protein [Clostridia bacterium]
MEKFDGLFEFSPLNEGPEADRIHNRKNAIRKINGKKGGKGSNVLLQ